MQQGFWHPPRRMRWGFRCTWGKKWDFQQVGMLLLLKTLSFSKVTCSTCTYAGDRFHKYSSQIKQKYRKRNKPPFFKPFTSGFWGVLEDQRQSDAPFEQQAQYRLQSSESQKLPNWKLNLIYSAALDWEGHSSFTVFHNGNPSLFILPNYILTLENYIMRAVTSLNNCHSKTFCNALWCLPKQAIWRLETVLCQNNWFIYDWGICFLQLCIIKAAATPVGLRHLMCVSFIYCISHWKPGPNTKIEIMKTGQT